MILLVVLLSLSSQATQVLPPKDASTTAAPPCIDCEVSPHNTSAESLEWWSATVSQVYNGACTRSKKFTEKEMLKHLSLLDPDPYVKIDKEVAGIKFKNESPALVALFERIHSPEYVGQEPLKLKSKCDKVFCAMNELYKKPVSTQLLFMMSEYGFIGSRLGRASKDHYSPWVAHEIDDVLLALDAIPPSMRPIKEGTQLLHFKRGYKKPDKPGDNSNEFTVANSKIEVFDPWNEETSAEKRQALIHEIGHLLGFRENRDIGPEWLAAAGWQVRPNASPNTERDYSNYVGSGKGAPSQYSQKSPAEDFAETVVAYRYNPQLLQKKSPSRYQYMKEKVFRGQEFKKDADCENNYKAYEYDQAVKEKIQKDNIEYRARVKKQVEDALADFLVQKKDGFKLSEAQHKGIMKKCLDVYMDDIAYDRKSASHSCINQQIVSFSFAKFLTDRGVPMSPEFFPREVLEKIPVTEKDTLTVTGYFSKELSKAFNEDYESSLYRSGANNVKECQSNTEYYLRKVPASVEPYLNKNSSGQYSDSIQRIVAKACVIGLDDFADGYIPRRFNPFAKNPFEKVFR